MSLSSREIKFKFLMEDGTVTEPYYLRELIDSNSYVNIECEWNSKIKQELQYTGKKDKNDIEIYEGDLLKPFYDDGEIHEVIWHEESASFRVATYLDNLHGGTFAELFFMDDINEDCNEVVGNIYENPELLKG